LQVSDEKHHDEDYKDEGITFSGLTGHARLPAKIAEAMAPAAVWFVYSLSASIFFCAICYGLSLIWK
jgi:hypothetical protein